MTLASFDRVLTQQALITGRVRDAITDRATRQPPSVELLERLPGGATRRFPLAFRLSNDGAFVAAGDPSRALPRLQAGASLDLRLVAQAAGYQPAAFDFSLDAAELTPAAQVRVIAGRDVTVSLLDAPLLQHDFGLLPLPVALAGRVVEADDPEAPIDGAQVSVIAPGAAGPVSADADGFFTLVSLPVAAEITVRVEKVGFATLDRAISLDFSQPVNRQTFALTTP